MLSIHFAFEKANTCLLVTLHLAHVSQVFEMTHKKIFKALYVQLQVYFNQLARSKSFIVREELHEIGSERHPLRFRLVILSDSQEKLEASTQEAVLKRGRSQAPNLHNE